MSIELTVSVRSSKYDNYKVKINPLQIVLIRKANEGKKGSTIVELSNSPDNQTTLMVTEKVNEEEKKIDQSPIAHFLRKGV